jgi:short subunit dehydrogenase-like uncharacterized protein
MPKTARRGERPFDVLLYGATGFVGVQTVQHFARYAPAGLRWAIGGRDGGRLQQVLAAHAAGSDAGIVVADAMDASALLKLAQQCRVVLSTAGPYARFGSGLVQACVQAGTHYVDITGETPWVRGLIDQHQAQAAADGTRIVPCCGFDSVPSDLGAWALVEALAGKHGEPVVEIKAAFSLKGGLNGGTFASLLGIIESGQRKRMAEPFLLNPPGTAPADLSQHPDPLGPVRDADFEQAWLAPFVMAQINSRVVRRSVALAHAAGETAASPQLRYTEYQRIGQGPAAALAAAAMSFGLETGQQALGLTPLRRIARRLAPAPGEGPSVAQMDGGGFRCRLFGRTRSGKTGRAMWAVNGDPGNRATTIYVCEAALALAQGAAQLPGGAARGGVLTPAFAFGATLLQRVQARGMRLEISLD